jgi:hypothetical protein
VISKFELQERLPFQLNMFNNMKQQVNSQPGFKNDGANSLRDMGVSWEQGLPLPARLTLPMRKVQDNPGKYRFRANRI